MKRIIFFTFIFVFSFFGVAFAITPEQFMEQYANNFIYRVDYPSGGVNYISSPVELYFSLGDDAFGVKLDRGKSFVIENPSGVTYYRLTSSGSVRVHNEERYTIHPGGRTGYEGYIDIYKWSGYGFFLPYPSTFLRVLDGPIRMILRVGFGILSLMLLIRLLAGYFRRWLLRST